MRKVFVLLFFIIFLAACNSAGNSNSAEDKNAVNESNQTESNSNNDVESEVDEDDGNVMEGEDESGFTYDITEITGDDRFMPLSGNVEELIEFDEVIADNEHFRVTLVRYIFLSDSLTFAYQLEIENKLDREINLEIINSLADGVDRIEVTSLITGNSAYLLENETVYETLIVFGFEEEITKIDELKVEFEVKDMSPEANYDILGAHEIVIDF